MVKWLNIMGIMILIKCKHVNREVDGSIPDDIGPILDDRLKEKLKPWKGAHSSHFRVCVCLSVCLSAGYRAHLLA